MLPIVAYRKVWYFISGALVVASFTAVALWQFKPGVDFTGGALWELAFKESRPPQEAVLDVFRRNGIEVSQLASLGDDAYLARTKFVDGAAHAAAVVSLKSDFGEQFEERRFETIGPTLSAELRRKAVGVIIFVVLAIIFYVAWAFRRVSQPVASWKYGVIAVAALIHDVAIPAGIFSVLGHFRGVEVDVLFITALLTVMGFSVHDTIVVFDRVRERLQRREERTFEDIVNTSVNQTLGRSINTSLTVALVLAAIYVFGAAVTRYFTLAMLIGILVGTYSSIFIASPLLVTWYNVKQGARSK